MASKTEMKMLPSFKRGPQLLASFSRTALELGGVFLIAAPYFVLTALNYMRLDLWIDELISLRRYILVSFMRTVTDYSSTNNHVLFNMLTRKVLRLLGFRKLYPLLEQPWILRSLMLVIGTATILAVYLVFKRFFGRSAGVLAAAILTSTIPFYNYAIQVRGYALSMLLLCLLLYLVWSLEERMSVATAAGVAITSCLLLYTVPSNLYPVGAIMTTQAVFLIVHLAGRRARPAELGRAWRNPAAIILSCAVGISVAALLYMPLYAWVGKVPHLRPSKFFNTEILSEIMPEVMLHLLSERWALLLFLPLGVAVVARRARSGDLALLKKYVLLLSVLLLPFLFSFVRRDRSFARVFVNLTPIAALFLALNVHLATEYLARARKAIVLIVVAAVWGYCTMQFTAEVARKDRFLLEKADATEVGRRWHTIYAGYYQSGYQPREIVGLTKDFLRQRRSDLPVYLAGKLDATALPTDFLISAGVAYRDLGVASPRDYPPFKEALFIVAYPRLFGESVKRELPGATCVMVNSRPMLANLFYCRQAPA